MTEHQFSTILGSLDFIKVELLILIALLAILVVRFLFWS
jgi:hypothetical protein